MIIGALMFHMTTIDSTGSVLLMPILGRLGMTG